MGAYSTQACMKIVKILLPIVIVFLILVALGTHVKVSKKSCCINQCGNKICDQIVCYKNDCVCVENKYVCPQDCR